MLSTEEPARRPYNMASLTARSFNHHRAISRKQSPPYPADLHTTMQQHIWVITGPAGCGKTTVGQGLAKELDLPYIEGDDVRCNSSWPCEGSFQSTDSLAYKQYHPKSNKDKMANGIPLTDADRWDWLIQLRKAAINRLASNSPSHSPPSGVVVTCSALKQKYRDVMRVAAYDHPSVMIHFIYLRADEQTLLQRVRQRKNHYMKSDMVHSQLENLEEPNAEWDAISVDCAASPTEVQRRVTAAVQSKLDEYK